MLPNFLLQKQRNQFGSISSLLKCTRERDKNWNRSLKKVKGEKTQQTKYNTYFTTGHEKVISIIHSLEEVQNKYTICCMWNFERTVK